MTMDPFATLGAPRRFDLDLAVLEKTHRELSRALHPDKFAQAGASERRAALEKAANVNEAWRILRDPIRRAEALFRALGFAVGETNEPKASPAFLMEVMEEREALAEARAAKDLGKVQKLGGAISVRAKAVEGKLTAGFSGGAPPKDELEKLLPLLGELRFYRRFLDEVEAIEEEAREAEEALAQNGTGVSP
ncbi:MAG: Fe-S protein assembly co-chaperone HscB [Myxococcales bacterium 68-20]|nr:Fe-S protein assembly co-chaperone HscB [Myxococcales bacterium]OJY22538.1 MAG: Fe-S protein assembly co-chaperone HscB [Myxococcales bacterium 68-20]